MLLTGGNPCALARRDHDGDGDYDEFDATIEDLLHGTGVGNTAEEISALNAANAVHEFFEDVGQLFDGNPGNDSFFDGGMGAGDEVPTEGPSGSVAPVYFVSEGEHYMFAVGVFTYLGGGVGARWDYVGDGNMDIFPP